MFEDQREALMARMDPVALELVLIAAKSYAEIAEHSQALLVFTRSYTLTSTPARTYIGTRASARRHAHGQIHKHTQTHTYTQTHTQRHTHTNTHTHTHTHTQTHTQTQGRTLTLSHIHTHTHKHTF